MLKNIRLEKNADDQEQQDLKMQKREQLKKSSLKIRIRFIILKNCHIIRKQSHLVTLTYISVDGAARELSKHSSFFPNAQKMASKKDNAQKIKSSNMSWISIFFGLAMTSMVSFNHQDKKKNRDSKLKDCIFANFENFD